MRLFDRFIYQEDVLYGIFRFRSDFDIRRAGWFGKKQSGKIKNRKDRLLRIIKKKYRRGKNQLFRRSSCFGNNDSVFAADYRATGKNTNGISKLKPISDKKARLDYVNNFARRGAKTARQAMRHHLIETQKAQRLEKIAAEKAETGGGKKRGK